MQASCALNSYRLVSPAALRFHEDQTATSLLQLTPPLSQVPHPTLFERFPLFILPNQPSNYIHFLSPLFFIIFPLTKHPPELNLIYSTHHFLFGFLQNGILTPQRQRKRKGGRQWLLHEGRGSPLLGGGGGDSEGEPFGGGEENGGGLPKTGGEAWG